MNKERKIAVEEPGEYRMRKRLSEMTAEDKMEFLERTKESLAKEEELREHIGDDNFFRRYGNPVVVRSKGRKDIVCMAWEYYQALKERLDKAINDL